MDIRQQEYLLEMTAGDTLEIKAVVFVSSRDYPPNERMSGEVYIRKSGFEPDDFDWKDGRFSPGVSVQTGENTLTDFIKNTNTGQAWQVQAGWNRLVVALVHNASDGATVAARFFINLWVKTQ